tara:strand:+ start:409 stop:870 length:462 start_codon:yes stop_codon:yes gene_type:complete
MGLKVAIVSFIIMTAMAGGMYWYYNDTQERMAILISNEATAKLAVQTAEATNQALLKDIKAANEQVAKLNTKFAEIRKQNKVLSNKLSEHDLGVLGAAKPAPVERIINGATKKAGRCFEILSGADLTEKEMGAKNAKSFNSECPWLWPGADTN